MGVWSDEDHVDNDGNVYINVQDDEDNNMMTYKSIVPLITMKMTMILIKIMKMIITMITMLTKMITMIIK